MNGLNNREMSYPEFQDGGYDDLYAVLSDEDVMIHIENTFDKGRTKALIDYARYIGIGSCIIECDTKQDSSKSIALKNGFVYEGVIDNLEQYRLIL